MKVNCAALADNLLESELFGLVSGGFTRAVKKEWVGEIGISREIDLVDCQWHKNIDIGGVLR